MTPEMIAACETLAIAAMADANPRVTVYFSNQAIPPDAQTYARFWVIPSDEVFPVGMGLDARSRNVGLVQIDVYGPKDVGAGGTRAIADEMKKHFHRKQLPVGTQGAVVFKDAASKDMGTEGEEHRYLVRIPYRYDFEQERA